MFTITPTGPQSMSSAQGFVSRHAMLPGCIQLIEREFDSYFEKANRIVGYVASDDHRTGLTDKINTMSTHFHAVMSEMEPVVPVTPAVVPVDETRVSELKQRLHQANQQIEDMERQKSFLRRQNKSMRKTDDKARKQADQEREAQAVRGSFMNDTYRQFLSTVHTGRKRPKKQKQNKKQAVAQQPQPEYQVEEDWP